MNESVGTTWQFGIVITFIFLFAAFLILAINYFDAFRIRNDVISIVEEYEGIKDDSASMEIINNLLSQEGYTTKGNCPKDSNGVDDLSENSFSDSLNNNYYCVIETTADGKSSFEIVLFYKFNLPVIGDLLTFDIKGSTNEVKTK